MLKYGELDYVLRWCILVVFFIASFSTAFVSDVVWSFGSKCWLYFVGVILNVLYSVILFFFRCLWSKCLRLLCLIWLSCDVMSFFAFLAVKFVVKSYVGWFFVIVGMFILYFDVVVIFLDVVSLFVLFVVGMDFGCLCVVVMVVFFVVFMEFKAAAASEVSGLFLILVFLCLCLCLDGLGGWFCCFCIDMVIFLYLLLFNVFFNLLFLRLFVGLRNVFVLFKLLVFFVGCVGDYVFCIVVSILFILMNLLVFVEFFCIMMLDDGALSSSFSFFIMFGIVVLVLFGVLFSSCGVFCNGVLLLLFVGVILFGVVVLFVDFVFRDVGVEASAFVSVVIFLFLLLNLLFDEFLLLLFLFFDFIVSLCVRFNSMLFVLFGFFSYSFRARVWSSRTVCVVVTVWICDVLFWFFCVLWLVFEYVCCNFFVVLFKFNIVYFFILRFWFSSFFIDLTRSLFWLFGEILVCMFVMRWLSDFILWNG